MLVRETTDQSSPLALQRYSAGYRVPVMVTAGGQVYLSYCTEKQRETILQILAASNKAEIEKNPRIRERNLGCAIDLSTIWLSDWIGGNGTSGSKRCNSARRIAASSPASVEVRTTIAMDGQGLCE